MTWRHSRSGGKTPNLLMKRAAQMIFEKLGVLEILDSFLDSHDKSKGQRKMVMWCVDLEMWSEFLQSGVLARMQANVVKDVMVKHHRVFVPALRNRDLSEEDVNKMERRIQILKDQMGETMEPRTRGTPLTLEKENVLAFHRSIGHIQQKQHEMLTRLGTARQQHQVRLVDEILMQPPDSSDDEDIIILNEPAFVPSLETMEVDDEEQSIEFSARASKKRGLSRKDKENGPSPKKKRRKEG